MGVGGIGHLAVLFLGGETVFDDLAPGAVLVELGATFPDRGSPPEIGAQIAALAHDLRLFDPFGEKDVERAERHDAKNRHRGIGDEAALLERFDKAELVLRSSTGGLKEINNLHAYGPLNN